MENGLRPDEVMQTPAGGPSGIARHLPATADVLWLVTALIVKQIWVVVSIGWSLLPGGYWITLSTAALVGLLVIWVPQRVRPWLSVGTNALISFMFFGDVIYIWYFNDFPSFALLSASHQSIQVTDSVVTLNRASNLLFFVDLLPMVVVAALVRSRRPLRWTRPVVAAILFCLVLPWIRWSWEASTATSGAAVQRFSNVRVVKNIGVLGFHLLDAVDAFRVAFIGWSLTEDDWRLVLDTMEERRAQRAGTGDLFGVARGLNLVMIQIETLEGPVVGLEVDGQEVTPTLNRIASEGVYLSLCMDQTARGRTSDAEMLSQASLLPAELGASVFFHSGNDLVGLADVLGERGYKTVVGIPHEARFWNRRYSHPAFGFSEGWYVDDFEPGPKVGWGLNDRDFLRQAADRVVELPEPFFAFLLTLSNHHPFTGFPDDLKILDLEGLENESVKGYLHAMRWADQAVKDFLARLEAAGLADTTMVVVWGDHDSSLIRTPKGAKAMGLPYSRPESFLYDRVPVVISVPGDDRLRGVVDSPTGLSDLPPTVAALLGVDPENLPWLGRNLAGAPVDEPIIWGVNGWVDSSLIYRARDSSCWDREEGTKADEAVCAEKTEQALRMRRVATLMLEGDLQQRLRSALEEGQ